MLVVPVHQPKDDVQLRTTLLSSKLHLPDLLVRPSWLYKALLCWILQWTAPCK